MGFSKRDGVRRLRAPHAAEAIPLNQVGFYPAAPKVAVVVGATAGRFSILTPGSIKVIFTGRLSATRCDSLARQTVRQADFLACHATGTLVLAVPGVGSFCPFQIKQRVHEAVARAALQRFYYQRVSLALSPAHAGTGSHPA